MIPTWPLTRGTVVRARYLDLPEPKLFLVVSNNARNKKLEQVLAVRLTTSPKPNLSSIVTLGHPEVFVGSAVCDDIVEIYEDEVIDVVGALTFKAMQQIGAGLRAALAL